MNSTFFFAARHRLNPGAHPHLDVAYDIREGKYQPVFARMRRRQIDIGLLASYNAHKSADTVSRERYWLHKESNAAINGLNHHLSHTGEESDDTWAHENEVGFTHGLSVPFSDQMGHRLNLAWPLFPWHKTQQRQVNMMLIPTLLTDNCLFGGDLSTNDVSDKIEKQLAIMKRVGGVGAISWQVRSSLPLNQEYREQGKSYLRLLEMLASDEEVWVCDLQTAYTHFHRRWQQLQEHGDTVDESFTSIEERVGAY